MIHLGGFADLFYCVAKINFKSIAGRNESCGLGFLFLKSVCMFGIGSAIIRMAANRGRVARYLDEIALRLHASFENVNYDIATNGELNVLDSLKEKGLEMSVVFDVGANEGAWSRHAARIFPLSKIVSFEIVPEVFEKLKANCVAFGGVSPINIGLSDRNGSISFDYCRDRSGVSSCVPGFVKSFHGESVQKMVCSVETGDGFCADNGIDHVNFLKIDVEGHEPSVLKGFEGLFTRGGVDIVQFEYGNINIETKFILKDFYEFFQRYGFRVGKIYPNGVHFRDYDYAIEDFLGPNFLAVRSNLPGLVDVLKC